MPRLLRIWCAVCLLLLTLLTACGDSSPTASAPPATTAASTGTTAASGATVATTAAAATSGAPVELTWANWAGSEDATKQAVAEMIKGFEAKYPNVKVKSVPYPFNQMKDQLLISAAGGNAPDIAQVHVTWVAALNNAKMLQPLDGLVDKAVLDDFYPNLLKGLNYDGKQIGLPWAPSPILLYYNKNLLKRAGFDNPPKTWAEMMEQARKIAQLGNDDKGNKIYGVGISSKKLAGAGYFFLNHLWNNGGEFTNDKGQIVLNQPNTVKGFNEAQGLFKDNVTPSGLEIKDLRNLFAQGVMGFHFDGEFGVGIFAGQSPKKEKFAEDYSITTIPGVEAASKGQTFYIEHELVLFNTTKYKNEARLFAEYLTSSEGIAIYNKFNGNKLPVRKSVASLDFYNKPENAYMKVFIEALGSARPLPATNEQFLAAMEELSVGVQRAGIEKQDPAKVVEELDKKIKTLYKQ